MSEQSKDLGIESGVIGDDFEELTHTTAAPGQGQQQNAQNPNMGEQQFDHQQQYGQQRQTHNPRSPRPNMFLRNMRSNNLPSTIDEKGEKYRSEIAANLTSRKNHKTEVYDLPSGYVGNIYIQNNKAFILVYASAMPAPRDPEATALAENLDSIESEVIGRMSSTLQRELESLNISLVIPEQYGKSAQMSNWIHGTLLYNQDEENLDPTTRTKINQLSAENFRINTDQVALQQFYNMYDPMGVPHRYDSLVGIDTFDEEHGWNTFMAMGAYTNFVEYNPNQGSYAMTSEASKFVPVVHLQHPVGMYYHANILGLMLPVAVHHFISKHGWLDPYTSWSEKRPNLGSLFTVGEDGLPPFLENEHALNDALVHHFLEPVVTLDIVRGTPLFPYMKFFTKERDATYAAGLGAVFNDFFEVTGLEGISYVDEIEKEITGTMVLDGTIKDTRHVDVFKAVLSGIGEPTLDKFRHSSNIPFTRIRDIREIFGENANVTNLYDTTYAYLSGGAVESLNAAIGGRIRLVIPEDWSRTAMTNSALRNLLTGYESVHAGSGAQFNFQTFNPRGYNIHGRRNW